MKIAVPVEGENLKMVTRTGRAPYFAIFEFDGNKFKLISLNENTHAKEHEDGESHKEEHTEDEVKHHNKHVKASKVNDCDYIVVRAVGPNMKEALEMEGIKIIQIRKSDGENALEVLENIKGELK